LGAFPSAGRVRGLAPLWLILSALGLAGPAGAADVDEVFRAARGPFQVTRPDVRTLHLQGRIQAGDDIAFRQAVTDQVDTVVVNSGGGDVIPALRMAEVIRARKLRVVVDGACVSSCANYLFVAGLRQEVRPNSVVLWHGGVTREAIVEMASAVRAMVSSAGAPREAVAANVQRIEQEMGAAMTDQRRLYGAVGLDPGLVETLADWSGDAAPVDGATVEGQAFIFIDYAVLGCAGLGNLAPAWAPATPQAWAEFKRQAGMERLAISRSRGLERRLCETGRRRPAE
jgi:ATP-dependent protease ClpP protease subunit